MSSSHCAPKGVNVSLPVLGTPKPRSRMGPWRAIVLGLVHVVFVVHLVQWLYSGMSDGVRSTLSPIEPSESMFTLEGGQVNAGFVIFCLALLSTAVLGRFFCGWACHVIALQDACGWAMKKLGVHPKPFRSRLLLWAPLALALYMFVWPTVRREVVVPMVGTDVNRDGQHSGFVNGLRESAFGIDFNGDGKVSDRGDPADLVAGVREAAVGKDLNGNGSATDVLDWVSEYPLWLGDVIPLRGFTSHFIVEDFWATFAPWQIGIPFLIICGWVTVYFLGSKAFCSYGCPYGGFFAPLDRLAPVRIRVNDNCHQCGHCTAVCTSNVRVHEEVRDYGAVVDPGCMKCLDCVSVCPNGALRVGVGAPAVLAKPRVSDDAAARSAERAARRWDLSWPEEIVIGVLMLVMVVGYRGMYKMVPVLMAMGIASVVCFLLYKTWRMGLDRNVRGPFAQLKRDGKVRPAGWLFALLAVASSLVGLQGFAMNFALNRGELLYAQINTPSATVFSPGYSPSAETQAQAKRAVKWFELAGPIKRGGFGFFGTFEQDMRLAWLNSVAGDFEAGEAALTRAMQRREPGGEAVGGLMQFFRLRQAPAGEVERTLRAGLDRWPRSDALRSQLAGFYLAIDQQDPRDTATLATDLYRAAVASDPADIAAVHSFAILHLRMGKPAEAVAVLQAGLQHRPHAPLLRERLAEAMFQAGADPAVAVVELRAAAERQPTPQRWQALAQIYGQLGRLQEEESARKRVEELLKKAPPQQVIEIAPATR